jgi:large subunit ribosomal protein L20
MRTKTGTTRKKRHKKVLKRTKGFRMTKGRLYKVSKEADLHAGQYAFMGRKLRKRDMRRLWIQRINAALTPFNLSYSKFIHGLKKAKITLNRKMLADLALSDADTFKAIAEKSKAALT